MSEMIERVAKAIHDAEYGNAVDFSSRHQAILEFFRHKARAAIAAMREPTDAMVSAADSDWGPQLRDNWRQMIDAALS